MNTQAIEWSEGRAAGNYVLTAKRAGWSVTMSRLGQQVYATVRPPAYMDHISRRFSTWADAQNWAEAVLTASPENVWAVASEWQP